MGKIGPAAPQAAPARDLSAQVTGALALLPGDWDVLRGCPLGDGGREIDFVLLNGWRGVVLISGEAARPGEPRPDARLRRALENGRFPAIFGDWPPMLSLVVATGDAPADIAGVISASFDHLAPVALPGGDAWVGVVRRAAESAPEPPVSASLLRRGPFSSRAAAIAGAAALGCAAALAFKLLAPAEQDAAPAPAERAASAEGAQGPFTPSAPLEQRAAVGTEAAAAPLVFDKFSRPPPVAAPAVPPLRGAAEPEQPTLPPRPSPQANAIEAVIRPPQPAPDAATAAVAGPRRQPAASSPEPRPRRDPARPGVETAAPTSRLAASRCLSILSKTQLGEAVTDEDVRYMRRGC